MSALSRKHKNQAFDLVAAEERLDADERDLILLGPVTGAEQRPGLRLEIVRRIDSLQKHANGWNRLAYASPQKVPTLSHAWVSTYFKYELQPGETWMCLFAYDGAELAGLVPVIITPGKLLGLIGPSASTPESHHAFSVDFLAAPGRESEVIPMLLWGINKVMPSMHGFGATRLPETSPTLAAFNSKMREFITVREFNGDGSYLSIPESSDNFLAGLGANFRRNLSKARKKLAKLEGVKTIFLSGEEATEKELRQFMRVESSGWKGKAGTAIALSPTLVLFYTELSRHLSELGWLEWHFLQAGDRVIAAHMAARMDRTLVLLKIGYDEEYSFCSPGNMLFERAVERAISSRDTDVIDCITDMAWHDNWGMQKRPYYNIWLYPRRPVPYLLGAVGRRAKIRLRNMPWFSSIYRRIQGISQGFGT